MIECELKCSTYKYIRNDYRCIGLKFSELRAAYDAGKVRVVYGRLGEITMYIWDDSDFMAGLDTRPSSLDWYGARWDGGRPTWDAVRRYFYQFWEQLLAVCVRVWG